MPSRYLVTGGAGFVGSHLVLALADRGDHVVVIDNLRTGHRAAVPQGVRLIEGGIGDAALLDRVLAENGGFVAVFHFAAWSQVGESMQMPMAYLLANVADGFRLIDACVRHGVRRFVLSSTAALFGMPDRLPIEEDDRIDPVSPYGDSKHMLERALRWADRVHGMRSACLRYFNAAGSDPAGRAGEDHDPETHLIPLAIDAALGRRPAGPRRTAPACATTSTSPTSPTRICARSTCSPTAASFTISAMARVIRCWRCCARPSASCA